MEDLDAVQEDRELAVSPGGHQSGDWCEIRPPGDRDLTPHPLHLDGERGMVLLHTEDGEEVETSVNGVCHVDIHPYLKVGDSLLSRVGFLFHRDA